MLKSIIVEDDPSHSDKLMDFLKRLKMPIEVIGIARSVEIAVQQIEKQKPDLIFLDIELQGDQNGFELLNQLRELDFDIIFTTAHIDKNIQEIRLCAVDYIVKPYDLSEVAKVLERYLTDSSPRLRKEKINSLLANIHVGNIDEKTIWVPSRSETTQLWIKQIVYCESSDESVFFHFLDKDGKPEKLSSSYGIGYWEERLGGYNFCKIHKSFLVNISFIAKFQRNDPHVLLRTGKKLAVSKAGKIALMNAINK